MLTLGRRRSCGRTTAHRAISGWSCDSSERDPIVTASARSCSVGKQVRTMTTSMGYASSSHTGLHFGLGGSPGPVRVEVEWPSGTKQIVEDVKPNSVVEIKESAVRP